MVTVVSKGAAAGQVGAVGSTSQRPPAASRIQARVPSSPTRMKPGPPASLRSVTGVPASGVARKAPAGPTTRKPEAVARTSAVPSRPVDDAWSAVQVLPPLVLPMRVSGTLAGTRTTPCPHTATRS